MCLGRETADQPQPCALAEGVFSALPLPCVLWRTDGVRAVMVNAAFRREFGIANGRAGPGWLKTHLAATNQPDEFIFRDRHAVPRRYRMVREVVEVAPAVYQAVFLTLLGDEPETTESEPAALTTLPVGVSLTPRESQVLDGIMLGKLNKVIASELKISPKTVELHRSNLMAKLRVHNVIELARVVLDTPVPEAEHQS